MTDNPLAQTIAEIAERERREAVREGDYVWAILCAIVEGHARQAAGYGRRVYSCSQCWWGSAHSLQVVRS
jgi:hypothetical protein